MEIWTQISSSLKPYLLYPGSPCDQIKRKFISAFTFQLKLNFAHIKVPLKFCFRGIWLVGKLVTWDKMYKESTPTKIILISDFILQLLSVQPPPMWGVTREWKTSARKKRPDQRQRESRTYLQMLKRTLPMSEDAFASHKGLNKNVSTICPQ